MATNTVAGNPDAYYGQPVTITASIEQILSKSAFSIDQRRVASAPPPKNGPTDVLVLVPTIQSPVELHAYVTVMGELVDLVETAAAIRRGENRAPVPAQVLRVHLTRIDIVVDDDDGERFSRRPASGRHGSSGLRVP